MKRIGIYIIFLGLIILAACKEDDYVYPPAITEILSAQTDETGTISRLIPDKGEPLSVENGDRFSGLVPDSLYRMIGVYEVANGADESSAAYIYSIQQVISYNPVSIPADELKTDPVTIQSIWRSGNYINLILQVKSHTGAHVFRFVENSFISTSMGFVLSLSLYHDKGDDIEAYTQRAYLSVPLTKYEGMLKKGDTILFAVNTYKEGLKTYQLVY